ncbi:hypothetical protein KR52_07250 [Synechococcus sp. KORDI-52]|nr:hypothetical protein KR52_07250 [Synechococcus sp. KORDI-52]
MGAIAVVSFAANFTVKPNNAPGLISRDISYSLELKVPEGTQLNGDNEKSQTAALKSGTNDIFIIEDNGVIIGTTSLSNINNSTKVFTVSIDSSNGILTFQQFLPIEHVNGIDTTTSNAATLLDKMFLANNQIQLTATVTDTYASGQSLSADASIDLGGNIQFADDGPTETSAVSPILSGLELLTGDGGLSDGNDKQLADTDTSNVLANAFINAVTPDYGADNSDPPANVVIDPAGSGFTFQLSGTSIGSDGAFTTGLTLSDNAATPVYAYLSPDSRTIEGRTDSTGITSGNPVFSLSINKSTGQITQTQFQAFQHSVITNGTPSLNPDGSVIPGTYSTTPNDKVTLGDGSLDIKISADVKTTDSDGDFLTQDVSSGNVAGNFQFFDDGPAEAADVPAKILASFTLQTGDGGLSTTAVPPNAVDGNDKALPASVTSAALANAFINAVTPDYGADNSDPPANVVIDPAGSGFTFQLSGTSIGSDGAFTTGLTLSDNAATPVYAYLSPDSRTIEGRTDSTGITSGNPVFSLTINQTSGEITQTQFEAFEHSVITDGTGTTGVPPLNGGTVTEGTYSTTPNDKVTLGDGSLDIKISADVKTTDSDGDFLTQDVSSGNVAGNFQFFDDGPADFTPEDVTLNNDGSSAETGDLNTPTATALDPGADELGSVTFTGITDGDDAGITSGGNVVRYYLINNGTELIASTKTALDWSLLTPAQQADPLAAGYVFTITLDPSQPDYTVQEYATIDGATDTTLNFNVKLTDGDLDFVDADFDVTWTAATPAAVLKVGQNVNDIPSSSTPYEVDYDLITQTDINPPGSGTINGTTGEDILIGDVGGSSRVNQKVNLSLVLDISTSMVRENISFGGQTISRLEALQRSVIDLLKDIDESGAAARVQIVRFGTGAQSLGVFEFQAGAGNDMPVVQAATTVINNIRSGLQNTQFTNYEGGLQRASGWINENGSGVVNNYQPDPFDTNDTDQNTVIFISDGEPNANYIGNIVSTSNTSNVNTGTTQFQINRAIGNFQGNWNQGGTTNDDTIDERALITNSNVNPGFDIKAVGIDVSSSQLANLSLVQGGGQAINVTSGDQLEQVLGDISGFTSLIAAGDDDINGEASDDLIFGDVTFTDDLIGTTQGGIFIPPYNATTNQGFEVGSGWEIFNYLETAPGTNWTRTDTINYIRSNSDQVAQETEVNGRTRANGNDDINGGLGNDKIYGQEGDDTIAGGDGNDEITGGTGSDSMTGGSGDDQFRFFKGQGVPTKVFFDDFDTETQLSANGRNWGQWDESGDSDGNANNGTGRADTGVIRAVNDTNVSSTAIRFDNADNNKSLTSDLITINQSDINQNSVINLSFDWVDSANQANEYVEVYLVSPGNNETTTNFRVTGTSGGSGSQTLDLTQYFTNNISGNASLSFSVRFKSSGNWESTDEIYFDNVKVNIVNPTPNEIDIIDDFRANGDNDTISIVGDNISQVAVTQTGIASQIGGTVYKIAVQYSDQQADEDFYVDVPTGSLQASGQTASSGSNTPNITIAADSATLDGPIAGAQLFLDQDFDGSIDADELIGVTDANGEVAWQIPLADLDVNQDGIFTLGEARAVQTGGTDTETGLSYAINLFGPAAGGVITPLTSLLQARIENGDERASAQADLQQALDLPTETPITALNPMTSTAEVFATTAGVMTLAVQLAELSAAQQQSSPAEVSFEVFTALADQIVANAADSPIQLADKQFINDVTEQLSLDGIDANVVDFLSSSQLAIESAILPLTPDDDAVDAVSAVQVLTQGDYTDVLTQVANAELSSDALLDLTGNLNQIAEGNGLNSDAVEQPPQPEQETAAGAESQATAPEADAINPDPIDDLSTAEMVDQFMDENPVDESVIAEVQHELMTQDDGANLEDADATGVESVAGAEEASVEIEDDSFDRDLELAESTISETMDIHVVDASDDDYSSGS